MKAEFIKINPNLISIPDDSRGEMENFNDLIYYYSLRGNLPEIILEVIDNKIVVKARSMLYYIGQSLNYELLDAVLFKDESFNIDSFVKSGSIKLSSLDEFRKKEDLENQGLRLDLFFFKEKISSENLKDSLIIHVKNTFDSFNIQAKLRLHEIIELEFISAQNCLKLKSVFPSSVESRDSTKFYGKLVHGINEISSLKNVNGSSVDRVLRFTHR